MLSLSQRWARARHVCVLLVGVGVSWLVGRSASAPFALALFGMLVLLHVFSLEAVLRQPLSTKFCSVIVLVPMALYVLFVLLVQGGVILAAEEIEDAATGSCSLYTLEEHESNQCLHSDSYRSITVNGSSIQEVQDMSQILLFVFSEIAINVTVPEECSQVAISAKFVN